MATPAQGKPSYEITGLWVRTVADGADPATQRVEILVEHEGAWRVIFGEQRPLGILLHEQSIDHCVTVLGMEKSPIDRCGIVTKRVGGWGNGEWLGPCALEMGHAGDRHEQANVNYGTTGEMTAYHELRQHKRGTSSSVATAIERVRRIIHRVGRRRT